MIYKNYEIDHIIIDYLKLRPEVTVKVKIGSKSKTIKYTFSSNSMRNIEKELQAMINSDIESTKLKKGEENGSFRQ